MFGAIFFTTNWEEFAALGVHTSLSLCHMDKWHPSG